MPPREAKAGAKAKLLDAALEVIRARGYAATAVDELCHTAGVTKGAFFHHFQSKEDLALAAARHFSSGADALFSSAPYRELDDPVDRLLAYVEFRKALLRGELPEFTCLLGTMVQEAYQTHPAIRKVCASGLSEHCAMLEQDIAQALRTCGSDGTWSAASLAAHIQAVIQGAFVLAKAHNGPAVAAACLDHLRCYIQMLFSDPNKGKQYGSQGHRNPGSRARRAQRGGAGRRRRASYTLSADGSSS
jgi:TetR/AcrR family transcriptional regulator, transcriptional repressor for nem operon